MTITNLPSYPQQYIAPYHHLSAQPPSAHTLHTGHHHHQPNHIPYTHHVHTHSAHHAHHAHAHTHVLSGPTRTEPATRKRPKYTRSKTGCLTCRVKKIKCDESKPTCTRCAHGQRECTWPENVPPRKKPTSKKPSEEPDRTLSPESASPSSSVPTTGRETSPARKSPLAGAAASEGAVSSRSTHSEPNTAAGSPARSPIDPPSSVPSRRPSLPQSVHSTSSVAYSGTSLPHPQQYSALTSPSVSPGSYHPSPASSHDYPSYSGSPVSNGHGGPNGHSQSAAIPRHELPPIQITQSRLTSNLGTTHNLGQWHTAPMMTSALAPIEPFFRTVQERNLVGRSPASYAS